MTTLLLLTILQAQLNLADATLPTRPTTFMVDDRLSEGVVENLRNLSQSGERGYKLESSQRSMNTCRC